MDRRPEGRRRIKDFGICNGSWCRTTAFGPAGGATNNEDSAVIKPYSAGRRSGHVHVRYPRPAVQLGIEKVGGAERGFMNIHAPGNQYVACLE